MTLDAPTADVRRDQAHQPQPLPAPHRLRAPLARCRRRPGRPAAGGGGGSPGGGSGRPGALARQPAAGIGPGAGREPELQLRDGKSATD